MAQKEYELFIYEYFKELSDKEWDRKLMVEDNISSTINANVLLFAFIGFYLLNFPDSTPNEFDYLFNLFNLGFFLGVLFFCFNLFYLNKCIFVKYKKEDIGAIKKYINEDFKDYALENNFNEEEKKIKLINDLTIKYAERASNNSEINNNRSSNNQEAKKYLFLSFVILCLTFGVYFFSQGEKINTSKIEIKNEINIKSGEKK